MSTPTVIEFFAPVIDITINALVTTVVQKMAQGQNDFIILISTPGGSVFHGLSAYNFLKGMPANITTHNFGSVDSIGVVLFCAGSKRLCVPQARFLLHGVNMQFPQGSSLEEKQLEEKLKSLRSDIENISKVVAENTGKPGCARRRPRFQTKKIIRHGDDGLAGINRNPLFLLSYFLALRMNSSVACAQASASRGRHVIRLAGQHQQP